METELVKMSPRQLVVPQEIRRIEAFAAGDRFVPFPVKNGVLFRKVKIPDVRVEFEKLSQEIGAQFRKQGAAARDVPEAVRWARKR